MIAVCGGFEYEYVSNRRHKEIITKHMTKTDSTFVKDKEIYYKSVTEEDLSDIYSVEFMIFHDFNLDGVPQWWKISYTDFDSHPEYYQTGQLKKKMFVLQRFR